MSPRDPREPEWPRQQRPGPLDRPPFWDRAGWSTVGVVLAVIIFILGLALLAGAVLFVVGISNWGSNK